MSAIDDYLKKHANPSQQKVLGHIRALVKELVPEVEEAVSYGVPTFKVNNKYFLYMGAFKNHMSLFPASDAMIEAVGPKLVAYRVSKGTLRFTEKNPIPDPMLKKIITYSRQTLPS